MTAIRWGATTLPNPASSKRALLVVLGIAAVVAYLLFNGQWTLPHDDDADIFRWLNGIKDAIADNRQILEPVRLGVTSLIDLFDEILASLGWTGVIALVSALGLLFGGVRLALLAGLGFAFIGVLGLWDQAMATLGILLAAVVIALLIGLPLGIAAGRSNRLNAILSPFLDVMQIMPTLAYLAPLTLLFLIGPASSTVATLIYALPAAIRITALGIRGVPHDTVEAASAFGATGVQTLRKVELPLARRAIALGINQTIMLSLSMVIIAGLIGAPGLARNIVVSLSKVDVGTAFDAGLAIVILAIVLDRLTDAAGEWLSPRARIARRRSGRPGWQRLIGPGIVLAAGLIAPAFVDATAFPDTVQMSFADPDQRGARLVHRDLLDRHDRTPERGHECRPEPARGRADVRAVVADGRHRRGRGLGDLGQPGGPHLGGLPGPDHPAQPLEPLHGDARERARRHGAHARDRDHDGDRHRTQRPPAADPPPAARRRPDPAGLRLPDPGAGPVLRRRGSPRSWPRSSSPCRR